MGVSNNSNDTNNYCLMTEAEIGIYFLPVPEVSVGVVCKNKGFQCSFSK